MNAGHLRNSSAENEAIVEPDAVIVDDWIGPDLEPDAEDAERALELAGADETRPEGVFEDIRRPPESDLMNVPADERPV